VSNICYTNEKKLEAAHHKFQRRLLGITWRDKVRNEDIRKKTVRQHTGNCEVTKESQDDQGRTG